MNCSSFESACSALSRRHLLKVGGLGVLGLNMPKILRAEATASTAPPARAKHVIFLFQWGGPSHIDMFDRKPDQPVEIRGPLKGIRSKIPGIEVCEQIPRVADCLDRFSLVRTLTHTMNNHNSAGYYALTGSAPPLDDQRLRDSPTLFPAYGSVVDRLAPVSGELPTFISYPHVIRDGSITPGQHASFLGKAHDPLFFREDPNDDNFRLPELTLPDSLSFERISARRELQQLIDNQSHLLEHSTAARGFDQYYQKAIDMLASDRLRRAFRLDEEKPATREAYGRTSYGQSCLLARRLVEAGVKFVTVYFSNSIGGQSTEKGGWDTHGFNNTRMFPIVKDYHLPITDQTLPTLIHDLEDRGLLDDTLVLWMGEFGRTPNINENASRDHWPRCYTALLAGGGVKRGFVYGKSDAQGRYPLENPVRPDDLAATLYHLLGINPATEVLDRQDRPLPIAAGDPILDLIA